MFTTVTLEKTMKLGCFSVSLAVKNLERSKAFYQKIGFEVFAGEASHGYLIMKHGETNIGLFQGMFEKNILTFNPGWNQNAENLESFDDVRQLLERFKSSGIEIAEDSVTGEQGPSSFVIIDPDGNPILVDQHV